MASPKVRKLIERFHERIVETFHTPDFKDPDDDALVALKKRHEECSRNLRNSVLTLGGFAAICWAALSKPDIELLSAQSTVKFPVFQVDVTLDNFLAVAPLTVLVLLIHGSVFRRRLNALDPHVNSEDRFSTLFNLPGPMASIATFFLHVFLPWALLVFLFVKTSPRESFNWNLLVFAVALIVLAETHMRRGWLYRGLKIAARIIAAALIVGAIFKPVTNYFRTASNFMVPLDYSEVDFTNMQNLLYGRNFRFARFKSAILTNTDLADASLSGANLNDADLRGTNLTRADLADANLTGADLEDGYLPGANLKDANLADAFLVGASLSSANLSSANLSGANLKDANLADAYLVGADLTRADLSRADLTGADLTGDDLTEANLTEANLTEANLTRANLTRANLTEANLTSANLDGANLTDANLTDANLTDAYFEGAKNIPDLSLACADPNHPPVGLPESVKRPEPWELCPEK